MQKDDTVYLGHMLDMATQGLRLASGKTREEYGRDDALRLALAHVLQIIGEAACRVSAEYRANHAEVPWKEIMGMRHKLVHDYMAVDEGIVWDTVQRHLMPLSEHLKSLLPPDCQGDTPAPRP